MRRRRPPLTFLIVGLAALVSCDLLSPDPRTEARARLAVAFDFGEITPSFAHLPVAHIHAVATDLAGNVAAEVTVQVDPGATQVLVEIAVVAITAGQRFLVSVELFDAEGVVLYRSPPTEVVANGPEVQATLVESLLLTTTSLKSGFAGIPYIDSLQVSGGQGVDAWSLTSGLLPGGLALDEATGVISGTPNSRGSETFTVTAESGFQTVSAQFTIAVDARPGLMWLTSGPLIRVVETVNHVEVLQFGMPDGSFPGSLAFVPDGSRAYVTTGGPNLYEFDAATFTVVDSVALPYPEWNIVVTPDGAFVYISSGGDPEETMVVETATNTVVATIPATSNIQVAFDMAAHPDGNSVWLADANLFPAGILRYSTATHTVADTFFTPGPSRGVAFSRDGSLAYLSICCDWVGVYDIASRTRLDSIPAGAEPIPVDVTPNDSLLYAGNVNSSNVTVMDPINGTPVTTLPVGGAPWSIAVSTDGAFVYVAFGSGVAVIDTSTNTVIAELPFGAIRVAAAPS